MPSSRPAGWLGLWRPPARPVVVRRTREPGAVDDGVGVMVHTVDGADTRRCHLDDRRCHQLGLATQVIPAASGRPDDPAWRKRENLDRGPDLASRPINCPAAARRRSRRRAGRPGRNRRAVPRHGTRCRETPCARTDPESTDEWRLAGDHYPAAAGRAIAVGQRPGFGLVVEHRADHLAVEDHEVFDAAGEQLRADGSGPTMTTPWL